MYADKLYSENQDSEGNAVIEEAVHIPQGDPPPNSHEADELSGAYQDRGWAQYQLWQDNHALPTGIGDQEKSVAIIEKAFGANNADSMSKKALLALMYSDTGSSDKGTELMNRLVDTIEHEKKVDQAWYVYATQAQMNALAHDYRAAGKAYSRAYFNAHDDDQKRSMSRMLADGIKRSYKNQDPQIASARKLLSEGKFAELDNLANSLIKAKTSNWDGKWKIDVLTTTVVREGDKLQEEDYRQLLFDLKKWVKANPHSSAARCALSRCYISYAWHARGSGYADTVKSNSWEKFADRLDSAKAVLDEDPSVKKSNPYAFAAYSKIGMGQSIEKSDYLKMCDECHRLWPTYALIDMNACVFLLPRWQGDQGEWESYAENRANTVGGAAGDKLYAQMVNSNALYSNGIVEGNKVINWPRVVAGFKTIIAEYPDSIDARLKYVELAHKANDEATIKTAIDTLQH
jgi:hypothetical protein